jgi:hypothetical protein
MLIGAAIGGAVWIGLLSLFTTDKHEAEADALVTLLQRAAERATARHAVA